MQRFISSFWRFFQDNYLLSAFASIWKPRGMKLYHHELCLLFLCEGRRLVCCCEQLAKSGPEENRIGFIMAIIMQVKMVFGEVFPRERRETQTVLLWFCKCIHGFSRLQNIYCKRRCRASFVHLSQRHDKLRKFVRHKRLSRISDGLRDGGDGAHLFFWSDDCNNVVHEMHNSARETWSRYHLKAFHHDEWYINYFAFCAASTFSFPKLKAMNLFFFRLRVYELCRLLTNY